MRRCLVGALLVLVARPVGVVRAEEAPVRREPPVEAGPRGRFRAVVRIFSTADEGFVPHLRGQLSDVGIDLVEVAMPLEGATEDDRVEDAARWAAGVGARLAIWLDTESVALLVAPPPTARLVRRPLAPAAVEARWEAAALIARSAVQALEREGVLKPAAAPPPAPAPPRPVPVPVAAPAGPPLEPFMGLSAGVWADGMTTAAPSGTLSVGVARSRLRATVFVTRALGQDLDAVRADGVGPVSSQLGRGLLGAGVGIGAPSAARYRWSIEAAAGAERFSLQPRSATPSPAPTTDRGFVELSVRALLPVVRRRRAQLDVEALAGARHVFDAPDVFTGDRASARHEPVVPFAQLGVVASWRGKEP